MILSFHPIFQGNKQILCAGREPDKKDLAAIRAADAVILPQGCKQVLYQIAKDNCPFVFPNYDARFAFPGKLMQIRLFRKAGALHPRSRLFGDFQSYLKTSEPGTLRGFGFPFVLKFDWGGEGDTVFLIKCPDQLYHHLNQAQKFEASGQKGFLFQEFVSCENRTLRVVVVYKHILSYWRRHEKGFYGNLSKGAVIDAQSDPYLRKAAEKEVVAFCRKTRINLAGFDLIFASGLSEPHPLFLEINYFFGRKGLGGSQKYYQLIIEQIMLWINAMGLSYSPKMASDLCKGN